MLKIEYQIKLNEHGRPCIDLSPDYEHNPEDKFFAIEVARYYLQTVFKGMDNRYDQHTKDMMDIGIRLLGQIGDEVAALLYEQMTNMGDVAVTMGGSYHIQVKSIEERDAIPERGFFYEGRIFNRQEGLRVKVIDESLPIKDLRIGYYELQEGIINDNWVEIT
jgi:hypothetical protein